MIVPFQTLPDQAKVWMYQTNHAFEPNDIAIIAERVRDFLNEWESHGIPVQGAIDVLQNQFIRVAAYTDEPSMCGRAQDAQVQLMKELEGLLNRELTNRMLLVFEIENSIEVVPFQEVEESIESGKITADTPFFDALVKTKSEFVEQWKVPAKKTWLSRYF